jgi:hypothetical protein
MTFNNTSRVLFLISALCNISLYITVSVNLGFIALKYLLLIFNSLSNMLNNKAKAGNSVMFRDRRLTVSNIIRKACFL